MTADEQRDGQLALQAELKVQRALQDLQRGFLGHPKVKELLTKMDENSAEIRKLLGETV